MGDGRAAEFLGEMSHQVSPEKGRKGQMDRGSPQLACQPTSQQGFARSRRAEENGRSLAVHERIVKAAQDSGAAWNRNVGRGADGLAERALHQADSAIRTQGLHRASDEGLGQSQQGDSPGLEHLTGAEDRALASHAAVVHQHGCVDRAMEDGRTQTGEEGAAVNQDQVELAAEPGEGTCPGGACQEIARAGLQPCASAER